MIIHSQLKVWWNRSMGFIKFGLFLSFFSSLVNGDWAIRLEWGKEMSSVERGEREGERESETGKIDRGIHIHMREGERGWKRNFSSVTFWLSERETEIRRPGMWERKKWGDTWKLSVQYTRGTSLYLDIKETISLHHFSREYAYEGNQ